METLALVFYGVGVTIAAPGPVIDELRRDFSFFVRPLSGGIFRAMRITVFEQKPPFERVPEVRASLYQPDSVSYDWRDVRFVDYNGAALSIYDFRAEHGEVYATDSDLLHELVYLLILSRVGELLDGKRIHRVHALGIAREGKGILCLLPQGGGKTTLALELLKESSVQLLSDDTPLITARGEVLPFPARIGIDPAMAASIPDKFKGTLLRRKYGAKTLVDIEFFKDHIAVAAVPVSLLLVGEREFSLKPRFVKAGKLVGGIALFKNSIIGLGLPQMVEYFLRHGLKEVLSKGEIFLSRFLIAMNIILKSDTYRFVMGRDPEENAAAFLRFIKNH
jgi:hypothetical protein